MSRGQRATGSEWDKMSTDDCIDIVRQHPGKNINRKAFMAKARRILSLLRGENSRNLLQPVPVEVSLVLTDDRRIRKLKKKYFGLDKATDVVAFPQEGRQHGKTKRGLTLAALNPRGSDPTQRSKTLPPVLLGDIVISLDHAKRQAEENGHSYSDEVLYLFIHGMLHLLGFRDAPEYEAARMMKKQNELWELLKASGQK